MSMRYWIHDSVVEDQPDVGMPFGKDTVGIVDEDEGGVFLYLHKNSAPNVMAALDAREREVAALDARVKELIAALDDLHSEDFPYHSQQARVDAARIALIGT